jgi:hypothetical protein
MGEVNVDSSHCIHHSREADKVNLKVAIDGYAEIRSHGLHEIGRTTVVRTVDSSLLARLGVCYPQIPWDRHHLGALGSNSEHDDGVTSAPLDIDPDDANIGGVWIDSVSRVRSNDEVVDKVATFGCQGITQIDSVQAVDR